MKSPKWLGIGFVVAGLALMACARAAPTTEDDEDITGQPTLDASADTSKPTPRDSSTSQPDSATASNDAAVPVDASRDATPPPPPPPDSSTTVPAQCTSTLDLAKGFAQITSGDMPPCDATCRGCCYPLPAFCVKPI